MVNLKQLFRSNSKFRYVAIDLHIFSPIKSIKNGIFLEDNIIH